jgi:hypothetical protein
MLPGDAAFMITFSGFKHSSSTPTTLQIHTTGSPDCPVQALKTYPNHRNPHPGPLFVHANHPVQRNSFMATFRACLKYLNISTTNYNVHSFRIGRTTDMADQNVPNDTIQRIGRWKSNAYRKYIRSDHISAQPALS